MVLLFSFPFPVRKRKKRRKRRRNTSNVKIVVVVVVRKQYVIAIWKPGTIHTRTRQGRKVIQMDYIIKVMDLKGWKMKRNINHSIGIDLLNKTHIEKMILTETGHIPIIAKKKQTWVDLPTNLIFIKAGLQKTANIHNTQMVGLVTIDLWQNINPKLSQRNQKEVNKGMIVHHLMISSSFILSMYEFLINFKSPLNF